MQSPAQRKHIVAVFYQDSHGRIPFPNDFYHYEGKLCKFSEIQMLGFTTMTGFYVFLLFYGSKQYSGPEWCNYCAHFAKSTKIFERVYHGLSF